MTDAWRRSWICRVLNGEGIDSVSSNLVVMFNKEILASAGYEDTEIYDWWRNKDWNSDTSAKP